MKAGKANHLTCSTTGFVQKGPGGRPSSYKRSPRTRRFRPVSARFCPPCEDHPFGGAATLARRVPTASDRVLIHILWLRPQVASCSFVNMHRTKFVSAHEQVVIGALVAKDFRFGVILADVDTPHVSSVSSRAELKQKAARMEDLGFDVLSMPDHLGSIAPFPAMAAAAQSTKTIRLGTCVLNAGFYKPALLARDAAEVNLLSDGRLELGLGAGYLREEFDAADLPFPTGGERVEHLTHVVEFLREHLPEVPIMVAGNGNRLLTMAARTADIVGLMGLPASPGIVDPLADRVQFISDAAGERWSALELNLLVAAIPTDASGQPDLALPRRHLPDLPDAELLALPGVLAGSPRDIAESIRGYRNRCGVTYITVMEFHAEQFAKVIAELR